MREFVDRRKFGGEDICTNYNRKGQNLFHNIDICDSLNCLNENHRCLIDDTFNLILYSLEIATSNYRLKKVEKFSLVPGWNECGRDRHNKAR